MIENAKELEAARHMLGHYGAKGFPRAGSFTTSLIDLMAKADPTNKARLLIAFPEYRPAVGMMATLGMEALEVIVRDVEQVQRDRAARAAEEEARRQAPPSLRIIGRLEDDA